MFGLDLLDFFRGRYSWRKLNNLLAKLRLSDRSLFVQARFDDPDFGEWVASQPEGEPGSPPLADWTPDHDVLVEIKDRLATLAAITMAAAGGKPPQVRPSRRPVTAIDLARERTRRARMDALLAEVEAAQARFTHNSI